MLETGQIAYEAYASALGQATSRSFPTWGSLPYAEQDAWRAAAHAAIQVGWHGVQRASVGPVSSPPNR